MKLAESTQGKMNHIMEITYRSRSVQRMLVVMRISGDVEVPPRPGRCERERALVAGATFYDVILKDLILTSAEKPSANTKSYGRTLVGRDIIDQYGSASHLDKFYIGSFSYIFGLI